jgi:hypothetical protein
MDMVFLLYAGREAPGNALRQVGFSFISCRLQVCIRLSDGCFWQHPASIELTMRLE